MRDLEAMALGMKARKGKAGQAIAAATRRGWHFAAMLTHYVVLTHTEKPGAIFIGPAGAFRYSKTKRVAAAVDASETLARWLAADAEEVVL